MTQPISDAIQTIVQRMREKHGVEPRIGFEWEFQLLNNKGQPIPEDELKELFKGDKAIHRIYEERGHGLMEITTRPESTLTAPDTIQSIQKRIGAYAKEKGYHLSAHPIVSGETGIHARSGSAGMHINSSLVKVSGGP